VNRRAGVSTEAIPAFAIAARSVNLAPMPMREIKSARRWFSERVNATAGRLNVLEKLAAVVSANLQRATRLRQSILQKAFTGMI